MRWIRQTRLWLILGLLLLIGSLVGARYINPKTNGQRDKNEAAERSNKRGGTNGIYAIGYVDTKHGMMPLFPSQAGEVVEVYVQDGQTVSKGQRLFRLDSQSSDLLFQAAELQVEVARTKIEQANNGLKEWQLLVDTQNRKIKGKKSELKSAQAKLKKIEELRDANVPLPPEAAGAADAVEALKEAVAGEEKMLEVIEAKKPVLEQKLAEDNLKAALNQQAQAKLAVDRCVLTAPSDGTIVRVATQVGNKFGPQLNANVPPIWFRPKGEMIVRVDVEQEWAGRVKVGQKAVIHDAANSMTQTWKGTVTYVADTFLPARDAAAIPNPFAPKQENVLECRVTLDEGQSNLPYINQKVRVHIGGN